MNLTRIAIEKNRITLTALLLIVVAGVAAYRNMPRNEDPGFVIRTAAVMTYFPGASPERVEQLVTDKLEKVMQEITELDHVRSESKTGVSLIYVDIREEYTAMRPIWDELRRKVEKTVPDLPDGVIGPFVNDDFGDVFGILIGLTGGDIEGEFEYSYLKEVADVLRDDLLLIDDVAKVEIHGAQEERIFIEYNNARLSELGTLTDLQLQRALGAQNIIIPGGEVRTEFEELSCSSHPGTSSLSTSLRKRTVIASPDAPTCSTCEDVADKFIGGLRRPARRPRCAPRACRSLGLAVSMREGGNIITLGDSEVSSGEDRSAPRSDYPIGIEFDDRSSSSPTPSKCKIERVRRQPAAGRRDRDGW